MEPHTSSAPDSSAAGAGHPLDRYTVQPQQEGGQESPFYKSSAPAISLPKGGGALKSIDEKFSVNAVNGTAGLEIPLPITPGRGGFTPALSLSYNSGSGNSPFGLGWNLSLPAIQRRTDKKLPRYEDESDSDIFLLAGAEDMVPKLKTNGTQDVTVDGVYTIKRYIPRTEGLFARIEYIRENSQAAGWWRVTTRDNITTWYGLDSNARIADPADESRIFSWLPQLSTDHKGNVQRYSYIAEDTTGAEGLLHEQNRLTGPAAVTNRYLKRVQYCNRLPWYPDAGTPYTPSLPDPFAFLMETVLDYGDQSTVYNPALLQPWPIRHDAFSGFQAGFEIRTRRKCRQVLQYHYFDELSGGDAHLVSSLELAYKNDGLSPDVLTEADMIVSATSRAFLKKEDTWYDEALPDMRFDYEPLHWDTTLHTPAPEEMVHTPQGLSGPYQWTDFDGEGISGILTEQAGGWFYKSNLGDGQFSPARSIALKPSFQGLGNNLQWQDLDADGRRQVVAQEPLKGYWELSPSDGKGQGEVWSDFQTFAHNLNIDTNSPFTKMLDLDGDGRADLLVTEDRAWTWYHNAGKGGFAPGGNSRVYTDEEKGPVLLLRDAVQSIFLADMNGDGLTDLVRICNSGICYWPNMGYGTFGAKVSMQNAPRFDSPEHFNPLYLSLADISGTGAADLVYLGHDECRAWINLSGNGWSDVTMIHPLPATNAYSKIAVLDFLGNGTGCLVWSSPLPQHAQAPLRYIDLMGGKKPYLMRSYNNGMGKTVSVTYKSSTQYYLDDKRTGYPWATRLPFPVHCIDTVTTADEVSETSYTQSYRYRHGYYDHEEREFRGFGYVETLDTDRALLDVVQDGDELKDRYLDQFPVLTKTWNHTGAWMRQGILEEAYRQEYFLFPGWIEDSLRHELPDNLNVQALRQAHRALKGSTLRREVYALDGSSRQHIPYSVSASVYTVQQVQPSGNSPYAVFMTLPQQSLSYGCERDADDPRVQQSLTLSTDAYGQVLESVQVAWRRNAAPAVNALLPQLVKDEQAKTHLVYSRNSMTEEILPQTLHYRLPLVYESRSFEVCGFEPPAVIPGSPGRQPLCTPAALRSFLLGIEVIDFPDVPSGVAQLRLLTHSLQLFKDNAGSDTPLSLGLLDTLALPHESYQKAFSATTISHCYGSNVDYEMLDKAGFAAFDGKNYDWLPSGTVVYEDPEDRFYIPLSYKDPWDQVTAVSFGNGDNNFNYWLLPQSTTDAKGNHQEVTAYDWRSLQPLAMKDANDNISEILYDVLGMPVAMALKGKGTEGDSLEGIDIFSFADSEARDLFFHDPEWEQYIATLLGNATWRCVYNLEHRPMAVGMIARTVHVGQLRPGEEETEPVLRISYSDGFGRVLMHKAPCEETETPAGTCRWVGSGRTVYNNKGKAVLQYEPYFSTSHECDTAEQAAADGVSPKLYYDPLGRNYRTELPDGTFTKTEWAAWQQVIWDNNDTVLESAWYARRTTGDLSGIAEEGAAAAKAAAHAYTPTVVHTDTLARGFYTIQYLSPITDVIPGVVEGFVHLDIQGNRLAVVDGMGREALQYRYNMLQQPCWQQSIDSGNNQTLTDVAGQPCHAWDTDGRHIHIDYDALRRPLGNFCDGVLLETYEYGEDVSVLDPVAYNLRGQLYAHQDSSGRQWMPEGYDFKGSPAKVHQALLQDKTLTDTDWGSSHLLEDAFVSQAVYDALGRPRYSTDPGGYVTRYAYDRGGALKTVHLGEEAYVTGIEYDAKGQRKNIWYGNGSKTRYTYDPQTYRLQQLLTTANSGSDILQELYYYYDPVGNITQIKDAVLPDVFFDNKIISADQLYTYDALYRLVKAEGREQQGLADFGGQDNYDDSAWQSGHKGNGDITHRYIQHYLYDAVGNIMQLRHCVPSNTAYSYTRNYGYDSNSNRLDSTEVTGAVTTPYAYVHDARGNMTELPHLDDIYWNVRNELHKIEQGTMAAYYQYSGGQRIRKYVVKGSIAEERIYLGSFEIYRKFDSGSLTIERHTVHISDDTGRIAMLEKRTVGDRLDDHDTEEVLVRYIYSNHLQSASLELDEYAAIISYEEYHPYGTTSFQSNNATVHANAKRYRYTGKERDEESGLYYHGARYYVPWLGRWSAVDPLEAEYAPQSPYNYGNSNPITYNDPSGMGGEKTDTVSDRKPGTGTASGYMEYSDGTPVNFFATQEETVIVANSVGKDIRDNPLKYSEYGLTHPFEAGFYSGVGAFLEDTVIGIGSFVEHPFASMDAMTQTLGTLGAYHLGGLSAVEALPGGMETLASMSMSIDNAWNNFKNGDAYTKANYAGYATAFVASFFIPGGGEAKAAEAAGELTDIANAASKVDIFKATSIVDETITLDRTIGIAGENISLAKARIAGFRDLPKNYTNIVMHGESFDAMSFSEFNAFLDSKNVTGDLRLWICNAGKDEQYMNLLSQSRGNVKILASPYKVNIKGGTYWFGGAPEPVEYLFHIFPKQ